MTENFTARLRQISSYLGGLSLPIRLVIGGLLGILGGSGFLGFISEFAGYSYAIHYGARPPLEGIPYLRASVTLLSLSLFIGGAFVFMLVYVAGRFIAVQVDLMISGMRLASRKSGEQLKEQMARIRNLPLRKRLVPILASSAALSVVFIVAIALTPSQDSALSIHGDKAFAAIVLFLSAVLTYTIMFSPQVVRWLALITTTLVFVVAPIILFNPHFYASLLRFIGYGGGLYVEVEFVEPEAEAMRRASGALFLRTSSALILYDSRRRVFSEIPVETVRRIAHSAEIAYVRAYSLPH